MIDDDLVSLQLESPGLQRSEISDETNRHDQIVGVNRFFDPFRILVGEIREMPVIADIDPVTS